MTDAIPAAIERMRTLWERERQTHRRRHAEERAQLSLSERVRRGLALRDLEIVDTDAAPGGRAVLWIQPRGDVDLEVVRIGPGDPVRLWWDEPDEEGAVRGVVSRRTRDRLAVMVEEVPERGDDGFRLDVEAPEATFDRGAKALARWETLEKQDPRLPLREVLFGDRPALFSRPERPTLFDRDLDEPQRQAVTRALVAETISFIHGPPGTGKTRCLVELVRQLVSRGARVLVSAASNLAVDNLAERLVGHGAPVLRLGHPARVSPAVEAHTLDALLERTPEHGLARQWTREAVALRRKARARFSRGQIGHRARREAFGEAGRLMRDARAQLRSAEDLLLARHPIVCATAAGADAALLRKTRFDHVVLDEATQATDPIALVALSRAPRATMAGDPWQLPPTVIDLDAARDGLGTTFFERASARGSGTTMLEVQHRMHETLMRFPSERLYEGRLRAHPAVAGHRLSDLGVMEDPQRPGPLVFLDTAGKGWTERRSGDDPSTDNPGQAARVIAEARRLLSRGLPDADLAIITPYLAQARSLRDGLSDRLGSGLEIGTVDGFQGREKEAVVVDLVRSNEDGEIGFLADVRRMNVAMTRAKRLLLVVGDSATLARHPFYEAFMAYAETHGSWVSAWSDDAEPFEGHLV